MLLTQRRAVIARSREMSFQKFSKGFWFLVSKVALRIKKKKTYTIDKIFGGKDNKHRKELLIPGVGQGQ